MVESRAPRFHDFNLETVLVPYHLAGDPAHNRRVAVCFDDLLVLTELGAQGPASRHYSALACQAFRWFNQNWPVLDEMPRPVRPQDPPRQVLPDYTLEPGQVRITGSLLLVCVVCYQVKTSLWPRFADGDLHYVGLHCAAHTAEFHAEVP